VVAVCSPVFQSIVSCTNLEISAVKSQNGELKTTFFGPEIFGEKDPQNQMRIFYAPIATHQVGKFGAIPPSRRYQPKYTRYLANFRISGVKKLLGQTHLQWGACALASVGHPPSRIAKFLGARPLSHWDMSVWKKIDWVGRNQGPIFRRLWTKVHQIW